jgi:hypothetical protein
MARNWLASAELPAKFLFYAVKRAAEVCNYFPLKLDTGTWTTPFELAHRVKPDLRVSLNYSASLLSVMNVMVICIWENLKHKVFL